MTKFDHAEIEPRWQARWEREQAFAADDTAPGEKVYVLDMFPYPSGDGLHVGHPEGYTATDILSRYLRMKGKNVLHPMGWDAFGLPAENAAIKKGIHPRIVTEANVKNFKRQIQSLGFSYDWTREVNTTDPKYYRWTQWIFLQLFKAGLAYEAELPIWWCPKDQTGLANEEVVDGCCERCGTTVEKKKLRQWVLKITKYADRLLEGLDRVDWPESIKALQRNWIGKSEGAEVVFEIAADETPDQVRGDRGKKKILIGTRNAAKVEMIVKAFREFPEFEFVSLKDLPEIDDSSLVEGDDDLENAKRKAEFYFQKTGLPTIATDHFLWIEKWPNNHGVISHIRKLVNPKSPRATDEEVIVWYQDFLKKVGGSSKSRFDYAIGYADERGTSVFRSEGHESVLQMERAAHFPEGYPTEVLLKDPATGEFRVDQVKDLQHQSISEFLRTKVRERMLTASRAGSNSLEKVAILIHGCPSKAGYQGETKKHWWPSTVEALTKLGYRIVQPAMPKANAPTYQEWKEVLENELKGVTLGSTTVAIGHSCGASFLARYLSEKKLSIGSLVLVAPAKISGHAKDPEHDSAMAAMFDFTPRPDVAQRVLILYSRHDDPRHVASAKYYADFFSAEAMEFPEREHFTTTSGVTEIPEMIAWVKQASTISVFTTRLDTLFGATYLVLAPEHQLVNAITTPKQSKAVEKYKKKVASKSDLERTSLEKEKTGVFTGAYAINPATKKKIPIWIADYVLASYGTGAIMAVPAHDERDHEFAAKFKLPIVPVIKPPSVIPQPIEPSAGVWGTIAADLESACWTGEGTLKNSGQFDGTASEMARQKIVVWLEKEGQAKVTVQYKLRDWIFSRQRYWGEPIPLVHCTKDGVVPIPEDQLPLELPNVEKYQPTGTGESPLAAIDEWVNTTCPTCGGPAKRETNTMPQWAGSCWYYLRYLDPKNEKQLADPAKLKAWLPVDVYVGGAEHAVLHLMYARFWHKVLFDVGALPPEVGDEPFTKLKNQGLILGEDGEKMSKSRGNVINPDEIVAKFGADSLRLFEMFMGPFEDAKPWSTQGLVGVRRFLDKVWRAQESLTTGEPDDSWHQKVKKISESIEGFKFNTCVSDLMKWVNSWNDYVPAVSEFEIFLKCLYPFAPHISEELWSTLKHNTLLTKETWPIFDPLIVSGNVTTITVQVNGKVRAVLQGVAIGLSQIDIESMAKNEPNVAKYLSDSIKKVIFVKDKLINFVV